jgi:hypothetical protein
MSTNFSGIEAIGRAAVNGALNQKINVNETNLHKNPLHQYASYNYLFTLSALTEGQLKDPIGIIGRAPTNVIARSAGIGTTDQSDQTQTGDIQDTLNDREKEAINRATDVLGQNRDIYFQSVNIETVHSFNPERRSAAVGKIKMILNEPSGVTLLDKLRAASFNCGYKDHVDAPYLLSLEFRGFDENGKTLPLNDSHGKRWIPIKIVRMNIRVNNAGATYDIDAIPYNESGFMNRFNYIRTPVEFKKAEFFRTFIEAFEKELNIQTEQESKTGLFTEGMQDKYKIIVDDKFSNEPIKVNSQNKSINTVDMVNYEEGEDYSWALGRDTQKYAFNSRAGSGQPGDSILKILEDAMLSLQPVQDVVEKWIGDMASKLRANTAYDDNTVITNADFQNLKDEEYYVDWFMIKSRIETDTGRFDTITMQHPKTITYYIQPYKIHIFRLVKPGVTIGTSKNVLVKKKYDYIFTGNNTDILDLDINYKVAYYQTKLPRTNPNKRNDTSSDKIDLRSLIGQDMNIDDGLDLRSYPAGIRNSNAGIFGDESKAETDLFQDALSNPQADMVKVDLKIIGDPSWLGVSQFFELVLRTSGNVSKDDKNKILGATGGSWNDRFQCFNFDTHDPIVRLNFTMPGDLNEQRGLYELGGTKSAVFSGLYQVVKVSSSFDNGAFTQTLHMVRFKNQSTDKPATKVQPITWFVTPDGKTVSLTVKELTKEALNYIKNKNQEFINNSGTGGGDTF